jgi:hypothetical protein
LRPGRLVSLSCLNRNILVETWKRILKATGEPESTPQKKPLAIVDVI